MKLILILVFLGVVLAEARGAGSTCLLKKTYGPGGPPEVGEDRVSTMCDIFPTKSVVTEHHSNPKKKNQREQPLRFTQKVPNLSALEKLMALATRASLFRSGFIPDLEQTEYYICAKEFPLQGGRRNTFSRSYAELPQLVEFIDENCKPR